MWMHDFQSKVQRKGRDIHMVLSVSLAETAKGNTKPVKITRKSLCSLCKGARTISQGRMSRCSSCQGYGRLRYKRAFVGCEQCFGSGSTVTKPCPACQGEGLVGGEEVETVHIPAGTMEGSKLRLKHKGHHSSTNGEPGDLIFSLKLKSDTLFKRVGIDIISKVHISVAEAVLGTTLEVDTIHGVKEVAVNPGILHGTRVRIRGFGLRKGNIQGDHCVTVLFCMPKSLTQEEHDLYSRLVTLGKKRS